MSVEICPQVQDAGHPGKVSLLPFRLNGTKDDLGQVCLLLAGKYDFGRQSQDELVAFMGGELQSGTNTFVGGATSSSSRWEIR